MWSICDCSRPALLPAVNGHRPTTAISDRGIAELGNLTRLTRVWLLDTKLTDAVVIHFKKLGRLEGLYLPVGVSQQAVDELKQALPKAEISRQGA